MKKNKTYIVIDIQENGKSFASTLAVSGNENLCCALKKINGLVSANICSSKKDAEEIAAFWNDCYKKNGRYMFPAV